MSELPGEPPHYEDDPEYYEHVPFVQKIAAMMAWNDRELVKNEEAVAREEQEDAQAQLASEQAASNAEGPARPPQQEPIDQVQPVVDLTMADAAPVPSIVVSSADDDEPMGDAAPAPPAAASGSDLDAPMINAAPAPPAASSSSDSNQPASTSSLDTGASQDMQGEMDMSNETLKLKWKDAHDRWSVHLARAIRSQQKIKDVSKCCSKIVDTFNILPDRTSMTPDILIAETHLNKWVTEAEQRVDSMKKHKKREIRHLRRMVRNIGYAMKGKAEPEEYNRLKGYERQIQLEMLATCSLVPGHFTVDELRMCIEASIYMPKEKSSKPNPIEIDSESDSADDIYGEDGIEEAANQYDVTDESDHGDEDEPQSEDLGELDVGFIRKAEKPKNGKRQTKGFKHPPPKQKKKRGVKPPPTTRRTRATSSQAPRQPSPEVAGPSTEQVVAAPAAPRRPIRAAARAANIRMEKTAKAQKSLIIEADEDADDESEDHDGEFEDDKNEDGESDTAAADKSEEPAQTQEPIVIDSDKSEDDESEDQEDEVKEPEKPQEPIIIESDEDSVSDSDTEEAEAEEPAKEPKQSAGKQPARQQTAGKQPARQQTARKQPVCQQTARKQPVKAPEPPAYDQDPDFIEYHSKATDTGYHDDEIDDLYPSISMVTQSPATQSTASQCFIVALKIKGKHRPDWLPYINAGFSKAPDDGSSRSTSTTEVFTSSIAGQSIDPNLPRVIRMPPSYLNSEPDEEDDEPETSAIGPGVEVLRIGSLTQRPLPKAKSPEAEPVVSDSEDTDSEGTDVDESKKAPAEKTHDKIDIDESKKAPAEKTHHETDLYESKKAPPKGTHEESEVDEPKNTHDKTEVDESKKAPAKKAHDEMDIDESKKAPPKTTHEESEVDESKKAPAKKAQPSRTSTKKPEAAKEPDAEKAALLPTSVPAKAAAPKKVRFAAQKDTDNEQPIPIKAAPRIRRGTTPALAQPALKPQPPVPKIKKEVKEPENRFQLSKTKNSEKGRGRSTSTDVTESSTQSQPGKRQVKEEIEAPENRFQLSNAAPKKTGRGRSASTVASVPSDPPPPPKPRVKKVIKAPENRYQLTNPGTNDMGRVYYGRSTRAATRQIQDDEYKALSKIGYEGQPDDERQKEEREDLGLPSQDVKPVAGKKRKVVVDSTDDEAPAPAPKKKKGNGRKNAPFVSSSSEDEDEKKVPAAPKKKAGGQRRPAFKKVEPKKLFGDKAEKAPLKETSGNEVKTSPTSAEKEKEKNVAPASVAKGKEKKVVPAPAAKGKKKKVAPAPEVAESSKAPADAQVTVSKNAQDIVPTKGDAPKGAAKKGAENASKPVPAPPDKGKKKKVAPASQVAESSKAQAKTQDQNNVQETVPSKGTTVTSAVKEGKKPLPKTPAEPVPQQDIPQTPVVAPKPPTEPKSVEPTPITAPGPKETAPTPAEPAPRKKLTFSEYLSSKKGTSAGPALVTKKQIERGASKLGETHRKPYHDGNIPVYDAKILDVPSPISEASEPPTPAKGPIAFPALAPAVKDGTPGEVVKTPIKQGNKGAALTTTPVPNTPLKRSSLANELRADEGKKSESPKAAGGKEGEKPQTPKATDDVDEKEEGEISDSSSPKLLKRPQEVAYGNASQSSRAPPPLKMSGSEGTPVVNYGDETKDTRAGEKPKMSQKRNAEEFDEDNVRDDPLPTPKRRKSLSPVRRSSKNPPR